MALDSTSQERIDEALASGQEEVRDGERYVRYRSVKDLLAAKEAVKREVAARPLRQIRLVNNPGC